jgi:hypothetical protein
MKRVVLHLVSVAAASLACGLTPTGPAAAPSPTPSLNAGWIAYTDAAGFTIQHPPTWQQVKSEGYPVVFSLPAPPGTNLLEKRMEIDVRSSAAGCRQSTYGGEAPDQNHRTINGADFLVQHGSGIAAGNIYDWVSYSTVKGGACITITFVLHSSSSGVYSTEPPPFDREAESATFSELIYTFRPNP